MAYPGPGYSAIDFTILDPHYGTMQEWVDLIDAMHQRNMYIILDFTVGTMGDLIGFKEWVFLLKDLAVYAAYPLIAISTCPRLSRWTSMRFSGSCLHMLHGALTNTLTSTLRTVRPDVASEGSIV